MAVEQREQQVRISVRDHGPGIPADFRPHMFEKFAQADATDARRKGGTGLGLSIVKQIVTRLGGTVGFEDAPGGGTLFHVDLAGRQQITDRELDGDRKSDAVRILLCADDPNRAMDIREGLKEFGFTTDFAHGRADAIARTATTRYGAIVVDLDLPDGDGPALIRDLRARPHGHTPQRGKTPIVGMTANVDRDHEASSPSPPDDWVDKPVDTDRLAQILDRAAVREADGHPRILHVDDDPYVLEVVARALGDTASVTSVGSVEAARQELAAHHFDLAVLDIELGPVSGLELLARAARQRRPSHPGDHLLGAGRQPGDRPAGSGQPEQVARRARSPGHHRAQPLAPQLRPLRRRSHEHRSNPPCRRRARHPGDRRDVARPERRVRVAGLLPAAPRRSRRRPSGCRP